MAKTDIKKDESVGQDRAHQPEKKSRSRRHVEAVIARILAKERASVQGSAMGDTDFEKED